MAGRKGKNRCEPDGGGSNSCRRCLINGTPCVFEKPERRDGRNRNDSSSHDGWNDAEGRVSTLEKSVHELASGQNQIQSTVRIWRALFLTLSYSKFFQCYLKQVGKLVNRSGRTWQTAILRP